MQLPAILEGPSLTRLLIRSLPRLSCHSGYRLQLGRMDTGKHSEANGREGDECCPCGRSCPNVR